MLYTKIQSKISINGYLSVVIDILRSVRQGCPIAPFLYLIVIETLLIKIRANNLIKGISSPISNLHFKVSAFADDTCFFNNNLQSAIKVMETFETFGKASGSCVNKEKTEAMWLGAYKNRLDCPIDIKWVKSTKSLGMYFGYSEINNLNWISCIDNFRNDLMRHMNRDTTIMGKVSILNYIGYSKLWFKSFSTLIPESLCNRPNGKTLDIQSCLNKLTQGFIWGFRYKNNGQELDLESFKTPLISKQTLFLDKSKGGVNLIDYLTKMKSFRILLVYKYLNNEEKQWTEILKYWYSVNLHSITNERWDHNYPHLMNIDEIPPFFRKL